MSQYLTWIALIVLVGSRLHAADGDSSKNGINVSEYRMEIRKMKSDADLIYQQLQVFELDIVEEEYQELSSEINQIEIILNDLDASDEVDVRDRFYDLFEETLKSYNTLITVHDFYIQLENKKEKWSNQYFNLWEQTYAYKTQLDNLYVREEKVNVHYAGMKDAEVTKIRKKNIYESCMAIYDKTLTQMKRLNDCDHYGRIQLLEDLLPVLRKCSNLATTEETKELEKELKNTEDPEQKATLILGFQSEIE